MNTFESRRILALMKSTQTPCYRQKRRLEVKKKKSTFIKDQGVKTRIKTLIG
jgi:hypothetical protein